MENKTIYELVNSNDEFLLEYNDIKTSKRFELTGFSGSVGDCLIENDKKIYLFVDSRYHEQADKQTKKNVEVVKLMLEENQAEKIVEIIKPNSILQINPKTLSLKLYKYFCLKLKEKKVKIIERKSVFEGKPKRAQIPLKIPVSITGKTTKEKIKIFKGKTFLITKLEDISYIMNMRSFELHYSSSFKAKLIINENRPYLFYDLNEFEIYIKKLDKKIHIFTGDLNLYDYNLVKKKAILIKNNPVEKARSIKNKNEIEHLKKCFKKTDEVMKNVKKWIDEDLNLTQIELYEKIKTEFFEVGAKALSFNPIVASGKDTSIIHYGTPTNKKIKDKDFVLIDVGAYFEGGYATDMTRTFVRGTPTVEQKIIYTTVLKMFLNAFYSKKKTGYELDKIARKFGRIDDFYFSHGLGHSVGISVHDGLPVINLSERAKKELKKGMVFTIEPGLYKRNYGGVRLENTVFINSKNEIESFSKFGFEEKLIDYEMLNKKEQKWLRLFQV